MKNCPNDDCPFIDEHAERATYEDHVARCLDCGTTLVPGEPSAAPAPREKSGPVRLALLAEPEDPLEANGIASHLEAEGIPIFMGGQYVKAPLPPLPEGMTAYALQVREADLEAARAVLEEPLEDVDPEELEGLEDEDRVETCARCGGTSFEVRTRKRKGLAALLRGPEEQYRVCTQCNEEV